jgi:hypothetical protein
MRTWTQRERAVLMMKDGQLRRTRSG